MADKRKIQRDAKVQISDASLERDPRFLRRIQAARVSVRAGHGTKLDDLNQTARPLHAGGCPLPWVTCSPSGARKGSAPRSRRAGEEPR
jgi:hypothetical protein